MATVREVACPDGGVGRTYTVDGVAAPRISGAACKPAIEGATVARAEPAGWAYRTGTDSVVILKIADSVRVSATTNLPLRERFLNPFTCVNQCFTIL